MSYATNIIRQKLRRSRAAMMAIRIIVAASVIAILAYPLAPDPSPDANRMIAELRARPLGFSKLFLLQPLPAPKNRKSAFEQFFTGSQPEFNLIPVNAFFFARDSIIVEHYLDRGRHRTRSFPISALLPPSLHKAKLGEQQMAVYHDRISRRTFLLGTDRFGRDIFSRLLIATRVSLAAGILAALLSVGIGILLGAAAGYYRGWTDKAVSYLMNILRAIPVPLLAFAITLSIGNGFFQILIAIGLTMWVSTARIIRDQVAMIRELEYVQAAKTLGLSNLRIISRHIFPNIAGLLMVIAASNFAAAILIEAGISFLGIGIQPPIPSLGLMIREHYRFLPTSQAALALIPGIPVLILAYAFNTLSNVLRDILDVREV